MICQRLIPSITGREPPGEQERIMLSLLVCLGGLGMKNPTVSACMEYERSYQTSKPLIEMLEHQCQDDVLPVCLTVMALRRARSKMQAVESELTLKLVREVGPDLQHLLNIAGEKGGSNWL